MADGSRTIAIKFDGDTKGLNSAASSGQKSLSKWRSGFSKLGSFAKAAGKAIGIGLLAAGAAAAAFGKEAIQEASDLNETINKTRVIFDKQAGAILKWSKSSATAFGLSQNQALSYASDLGNLFDQLGFTNAQTAKLSKSTVKFAADLGSFHNLDTADVLERIQGAMRGEFDSLQALIPNINAARVEQVAMARTGKSNAEALTAQEKAAATLAIIHKDGAAAAGDFEKTSGSLANQQKILSAQVDNLQAKFGKLLLPVMVALANWTTGTLIPALERFSRWFNREAVPAIEEFATKARAVFSRVVAFVREHWPQIRQTVGNVLRAVVDIVRRVVRLVMAIWDKWGEDFLRIAKIAMRFVVGSIRSAMKVLRGVIDVITGLIRGDWSQVWRGIRSIFGGFWDQIKTMARAALSVVREVIRNGWDAVKDITKGAFGSLRDLAARGLDRVVDLVRSIPGRLRNLAGGFLSAGKGLINSFIRGLRSAGDFVGGIAGSIWDALRGLINSAISSINSSLEFEISIPGPNPSVDPPDIPQLAHGGRATRGRTYLVGERGPELFTPDTSGTVHPNSALRGAGGGITIERLEVKAIGDRFNLRQVMDSLAWSVAA